jgi:hypothetical protein
LTIISTGFYTENMKIVKEDVPAAKSARLLDYNFLLRLGRLTG